MLTFLALVVAVIALVVAQKARREVEELREWIAWQQKTWPQKETVPSSPLPVAAPAPAPASSEPLGNRQPATDHFEPPPPPPPGAEPPAPVPPRAPLQIDWENLVGIKLFSWIAGIALVLSAVFLFKYSVDHGWLRPAVRATFGMLTGIGLLVVCELRIARNYRFTANAMDGAGIAILYATLFSLHARWNLWPATAAFIGMLVVTAAAVFLSTRRDSVFIALLGLIGGFATPALLSSGENRPIELFSYLLLLNGGIAWIAYRKRWPLLTALSVALTAIYQWAWIERFLTTGQLPLAAGIFLLFAAVGASSIWPRTSDDRQPAFRRIAAAGAVLPLLFAFFTAIVPEYGARYNVLFGFLLLVSAGLAAISLWRGPEWLHSLGGLASLLTFFIWLTVSYTPASWPFSLVWLAAFVALFLAADLRLRGPAVFTASLLFFVFIGLAIREPARYATLTGAFFGLLTVVFVFALVRSRPYVAVVAIALGSVAVMTMTRGPAWLMIASHGVLFAAVLTIAWLQERHYIVLAALPFSLAAHIVSERFTDPQQLAFGAVVYTLFLAYPLTLGARVKQWLAPHAAAIIASAIFFVHAYEMRTELAFDQFAGLLPFAQALLLLGLLVQLLRWEPHPRRLALVGAAVLAFLTIAVPVQLEDRVGTIIGWSIMAAALAWLFTRVPHPGLAAWSGGLGTIVLGMLFLDVRFDGFRVTYALCAAAMFLAAWLAPPLRNLAAAIGTIELFLLLNVSIGDYYSGATASSLARDLTYTIGWALFAIAMLVAGIALGTRGARVAALGLLLVTVLKCFLHDLAQLGGLYRVGSLFGLAVSLVLVGLMLQKFVMMKRPAATP
ncbi:MAG TPA: DUF2339 domain-containing protein [Thermoanaerobaculia bacterium]|jgi:hypothetical protein